MTEQDIIRLLYSKYNSHKYCLSNSYIFHSKWECDFFSVTKSQYSQEIEIKVSYSDFKADFSKTFKHNIFRCKFNNIKSFLTKGLLHYKVTYEQAKTLLDENGKRVVKVNGSRFDHYSYFVHVPSGKIVEKPDITNLKYLKKQEEREAIFNLQSTPNYSAIQIKDVSKVLCPNKFYYLCPEGIIPVDEVPEYAGLIYLTDKGFKEIKKAPFIHKDKQKERLDKILLEKFYWLSENQRIMIERYRSKKSIIS